MRYTQHLHASSGYYLFEVVQNYSDRTFYYAKRFAKVHLERDI
jgi:hypothetical protein